MLKCSNYNLLNELKKKKNLALDSVYYPQNWNHGMIYTTYKSGSKYARSNYYGITLTSCLGKLFSTLLHLRIENELEQKKLFSQSQAGHRKTDHIMNLFTLINKSLRDVSTFMHLLLILEKHMTQYVDRG